MGAGVGGWQVDQHASGEADEGELVRDVELNRKEGLDSLYKSIKSSSWTNMLLSAAVTSRYTIATT